MSRIVPKALGLALLLFVLTSSPLSAFQPVYIMGSSSMGGTYYQLAGIIAEAVNDKVPGVRLAVQPTGGTAENIENLEKGINQFALTDSFAVMAYEGRDLFYERPQSYLRAVVPLYPEVARILVPADSAVRSLADLAGRRVVIGRKGSGVLVTAQQILSASGLRADAIDAAYLGMGEGLLALSEGSVGAVLFVGPLGGGSAMEQEILSRVRVLGLDEATVRKVVSSAPYWREVSIPAGTFPNQTEALKTVGSWTFLACRFDVDDDIVHALTKTVYDEAPTIGAYIPGAVTIEPGQVKELLIPLHDGAERFFREAGVL